VTIKNLRRSILCFGLASVAAVAILLVTDLYREHARGLLALERQLETEAELVVQQIDMSLRTIDLFLDEIADEVTSTGMEGLTRNSDYRSELRDALAYAPQIASVALIDHEGRARLSSTRQLQDGVVDLSDRSYFQAHRQGTAYLINSPVTSRTTGREVVPVSMRLENAQGDFLGVVAAGLDLGYFADFQRQMRQRLGRRIAPFPCGRDVTLSLSQRWGR
jgi:two-component system sensor histidine kinase/response regulator